MHLTQLRLDPRSAQARRDLADPYDMHRTLVRAFVQDETQVPPRFLWRLEPVGAWSQPVVLVQSAHVGNWSFLVGLPSYLQHGEPPQTKTVALDQLLLAGCRYRFRLVANPTVTRQGKRCGLVGEDDQLAWLNRQGERAGFKVIASLVSGSDSLQGRKGSMRVSLRRVCFEGVLQAEDTASLAKGLADGIGPGKAFGCGLLSVARCA
jgi:CRISPR system Cascade subunit CasE